VAVYALLPAPTSLAPGQSTPIAAESAATPENVLQISTTEIETAITETVEQVGPAVVTVIGTVPGHDTFFGRTPDQQVTGSGVIITPDGYVVTNNHVVQESDQVSVILSDGTEIPAPVVSTDIYADLAVLKFEGDVPAVARFGNSDLLKPGETVIAIGSPLGDFKNSVTVGVVSATGRMIDTGQGFTMEDLIQTDAAINQGNSGGPLVNLAGEVVGINTLVIRGGGVGSAIAEGLGFAVPATTARVIAQQIIQDGDFARPMLGIRWRAITPNLASRYGLPVRWGAYVAEVIAGSPAAEAGLASGDIIVRIGDFTLDEDTSFVNALFEHEPGQRVTVEIVRGQERRRVEVTLDEAPSP
jgi:2-alkenal reductase